MAVKKKSGKKPKKAAKKKAVKKSAVKKPKKPASRPGKKAAKKPSKGGAKAASRPRAKAKKTAETPRSAMKRMEYLRQLLLKKRNDVVQGLESQLGRKLSREFGQKIDSAMDSADMSSQDVDQGIDYSLLEMKYVQYKEIADAFRKLQSGTYGLCEECGQEIDIKRLEVSPLARYCIPCKTSKEELEKIQKEETRFKE